MKRERKKQGERKIPTRFIWGSRPLRNKVDRPWQKKIPESTNAQTHHLSFSFSRVRYSILRQTHARTDNLTLSLRLSHPFPDRANLRSICCTFVVLSRFSCSKISNTDCLTKLPPSLKWENQSHHELYSNVDPAGVVQT